MMYRCALALSLMTGPAFAQEGPAELMENVGGVSSQVAWTSGTISLLKDADATRGAALHDDLLCASCHGNQGLRDQPTGQTLQGKSRATPINRFTTTTRGNARSAKAAP